MKISFTINLLACLKNGRQFLQVRNVWPQNGTGVLFYLKIWWVTWFGDFGTPL